MAEIAGKYIIERKLGQGASGEVFLVRHKHLGIRLALKILVNSLSDSPHERDAFRREAEVLFKFSHEGCTQLRDFGILEDGRYFMATDFSEGGTLRDMLNRVGNFDVKYSLRILSQILSVLSAAHQRGIIHRDVKPENIMVERDFRGQDKVKVLDFGVARLLALDSAEQGEDDNNSTGTPLYMSPEQALGEAELDGRSDIYSCGILAYEMIRGRTPFSHDDMVQILVMHVTQPPPPFPEGLFIPDAVQNAIFKSLEKNRKDRFDNATAFQKECERIVENLGGDETKETPPHANQHKTTNISTELTQSTRASSKTRIATSKRQSTERKNRKTTISIPSAGTAVPPPEALQTESKISSSTTRDVSIKADEPKIETHAETSEQEIEENLFDTMNSTLEEFESLSEEEYAIEGNEESVEESAPQKLKILVLDDDENILNIAEHILVHEGFEVFTASQPSSIHSFLFSEDVSLLITDVQMPDIPGSKVCQLIKRSLPEMKIVLFSNVPERELISLAKESKADGYISKSKPPSEWIRYIRKLLARDGDSINQES